MKETKSLEHQIETASKKLIVTTQQKIKQKADAELLRLETILKDDATYKKIDSFKDKFALCEIIYKLILNEHLSSKKAEKQVI